MSHTRLALLALYFVVLLPILILFNVGLTPDVLLFVLLGAGLLVGQIGPFVRDWGVFLLVLVLWQQMGGVAHWAGFPVHLTADGIRVVSAYV